MTTVLTSEAVVRWSSDQIFVPVNGEVTIMSIERGRYYGLDDVAGDIWQRLEKPVRIGTLCDALLEKYAAERATIEQDLLKFLSELIDEGLVLIC